MVMQPQISHSIREETPEAKARWFQSLTLHERMELLCTYSNLILAVNPNIVETKDASPITDNIRILTKA
jgi:hypothetical protein